MDESKQRKRLLPILAPRNECTGCSACAQRCPHLCIAMEKDNEGFFYPAVDSNRCIGCGLCVQSCPILFQYAERIPLTAYAGVNNQKKTRKNSSSGGIFSLLAENIINQGGVVFGAVFDKNWTVVHDKTDNKKELKKFRGSKYVQSKIGNTYKQVLELLKKDVEVLFIGTPCQVTGLHHFLGKSYERLLTIDFICHGVPSPVIWEWYVEQQKQSLAEMNIISRLLFRLYPQSFMRKIEFRNKANGWLRYNVLFKSVVSSIKRYHQDDPYMKAFLQNKDLRPSCYNCKAKCGKSSSDITLADFWNVQKVTDGFDDDKGTSLCLINSQKGQIAFDRIECIKKEVNFEQAIQFNPSWRISYSEHPDRTTFMKNYKTILFQTEKGL